ncbi:MAG: heme ABC exporter ATP-binding protein CcmA [Hyphomicrobiales bacterium]|nr:heme ABC exporter ATP-binding protein CcmA [Hyphomicrobiales bacterium]MCP5371861.1 heme ABC exporter ATP-binding protein CcmA [Hyphomicrobiales bacterium]
MTIFAGEGLVCIRGERTVFAGLDFALGPGGALVLVGPNGSGKSSLLRLMAGLLRPAAGALTWGGAAVAEDPEGHNGRLHYVGHLDAVKPVLSVTENLLFWARLRGQGAAAPDRVAAALATLGIGHLADLPGRFLSAGQKRRVNLARILAAPADLWLLDEPTTALDRASIAVLEGAIAAHRAGGGRVVVSTHADIALDGAAALDLADFTLRPEQVFAGIAGTGAEAEP